MHTKQHNYQETTFREGKNIDFSAQEQSGRWDSRHKKLRTAICFLQEITHFFQQYKSTVTVTNDTFEVLNYYYYYYYYYYIFCQGIFLLGISLEPTAILTARATIFRLHYVPYYVLLQV